MSHEVLSQQIEALPPGKLRDNLEHIHRNYPEAGSYEIRFILGQNVSDLTNFLNCDLRDNLTFLIAVEAHLLLANGQSQKHQSLCCEMNDVPIIRDYLASQGAMKEWFERYRLRKAEQVLEMEAVLITAFANKSVGAEKEKQAQTTIDIATSS